MKLYKKFFFENLTTNFFSDHTIFLFFKSQSASAKVWFNFRALLNDKNLKVKVLKKNEFQKFLNFNSFSTKLDFNNVCFFSTTDFRLLFGLLNVLTLNSSPLPFRPCFIKLNSQLLSYVLILKLLGTFDKLDRNKLFFYSFFNFSNVLQQRQRSLFFNLQMHFQIRLLLLKE